MTQDSGSRDVSHGRLSAIPSTLRQANTKDDALHFASSRIYTPRMLNEPIVTRSGLAAALLTLLTLSAPASSADEAARWALTPPEPGSATVVYVDIYDVEIYDVDEVAQTFDVGARMSASWWDGRLAFDAEQVGAETLIYQGRAAEEELDVRVWWPGFEIVDSRGPRDRLHQELRIAADGRVFYDERFTATIGQDLYLAVFRYAAHDIQFSVEPFSYDATEVVFSASDEPRPPVSWEPTEWYLSNPELVVDDGTYLTCSDSGEPCAEDADCAAGESCVGNLGFASATLSLSIRRDPGHYLWKIILPLLLIIVASSAVYWMDVERFPDPGDRFSVAFTAVLTVVAFDFVTSDSLPKLWYTTLMDQMLILGYVFAAINVAGIALTTVLSKRRPAVADRVVLLFRWLFPPVFLATVLVLVLLARASSG